MSSESLKILLLEDNDNLRAGLTTFFESRGHQVKAIIFASELLEHVGKFNPDVYVIDLNLPDADGLDIVKKLRESQPNSNIIIITARTKIGDRVLGYECGADIYLTKPVSPEELMAGISSLVKRRISNSNTPNRLTLLQKQCLLQGPESNTELTPQEVSLLTAFVFSCNEPIPRWRIAELLGIGSELPSDATIEMRISRLRKKLASVGAEPDSIKSVYKKGYVMTCTLLIKP